MQEYFATGAVDKANIKKYYKASDRLFNIMRALSGTPLYNIMRALGGWYSLLDAWLAFPLHRPVWERGLLALCGNTVAGRVHWPSNPPYPMIYNIQHAGIPRRRRLPFIYNFAFT